MSVPLRQMAYQPFGDLRLSFPGHDTNAGRLAILPALPKEAWPTGEVRGLRARGGLEVDVAWKDGRAATAVLRATLDGRHAIRPPPGQGISEARSGSRSVPIKTEPDGVTVLDVDAGGEYELIFD